MTGGRQEKAKSTSGVRGNLDEEYCFPNKNVASLVDAKEAPALLISPNGKYLAHLGPSGLKSLQEMSEPEVRTAGLRLSTDFTKSFARRNFYISLQIESLPVKPDTIKSKREKFQVVPENIERRLLHFKWNSAGDTFAFCEFYKSKVYLNVCLVEKKKLIRKELRLNDTLCSPLKWIDTEKILVLKAANSTRTPPQRSIRSRPTTDFHDGKEAKLAPTFQDLIKDEYDEETFTYYTQSQLAVVSIANNDGKSNLICNDIRRIPPAIYIDFDTSPNGRYLKLDELPAPFSRMVSYKFFARRTTVHKLLAHNNNKETQYKGEFVREISKLDADELSYSAYDARRKGRRSCWWSEGHGALICFVEALDDGNPNTDIEYRDRVCALQENDAFTKEVEIIKLASGFRQMGVLETGDLAIVTERWWKTKLEQTWLVYFKGGSPNLLNKTQVLLSERIYEDKYSDPGNIQYGTSRTGTKCPLHIRKKFGEQDDVSLVLYNNEGAGEEGYIPFLDIITIDLANLENISSRSSSNNGSAFNIGDVTQIWESNHEAGKFERIHAILNSSGSTFLSDDDSLRVLISQESPEQPPNHYLCDLKTNKMSGRNAVRITDYEHPYPAIKGYSKHIIKYSRSLDGVTLSATLYLPAGHDINDKGQKLPLFFWAYPRSFKSASAASRLTDSPFRFPEIIPFKSPLVWLTLGFAILDGPAIPIIATAGDDPSHFNDTFVEQLVSSAEAAVNYLCSDLGICDPDRVAVGGHSYGGFMTANLLIHSGNLFSCGIARSGAYNRTLTPFGFQREKRTFWDAPEVYAKMSPFFNLHSNMSPILLVHGGDDENNGTYTDQSVRMFSAFRASGVVSRLVVLPYEGHHYRARENVMHCLAETENWLRKHCIDKTQNELISETSNERSKI
eukprot:CAMPEP_0204822622 /NCGR_PEP_ID=MMETSP1346-20131115/817_1 /ASSEMBLY_ACC=CAM_ASM_000771 /TAXON_ID=215587 /ORGANISM="Aplanochytrium stocchinoi, Strain GSBS06" /LENGTH=902 /DNA_ID=CAMNT_0051948941 /DNA_START=146 /DNA_END=2854 /DNA_ORIENTATION=-